MFVSALAIMCKAPRPGRTKTRLAALIGPGAAADLSGGFLRDVSATIAGLACGFDVRGWGVYEPADAEEEVRALLPPTFGLLPMEGADFGVVLRSAAADLLRSHDAVVLINSDSPTLPAAILGEALRHLARAGDRVVLGPAIDGGYTLIGLKADHPRLFADIPWSTGDVLRLTVERACEIGLEVETVATWYDVDDAQSLAILRDELGGRPPAFARDGLVGAQATATRALLDASSA